MSSLPTSPAVREPSVDRADPAASWWERTKYPVMLRVPRGYVALAGIFLVSIVVLAYMVGQSRGMREGIAQTRAEYEQVYGSDAGAVAFVPGRERQGSGTGAVIAEPDAADNAFYITTEDPREEGKNYFVVATDDEAGAKRLLKFLAARNVEAAGFATDRGLYQVIVLWGFAGSERSSSKVKDYERSLQRLGAEWGRMPGGRSFTSQGMYPERYNGEEVAKIIRLAQ